MPRDLPRERDFAVDDRHENRRGPWRNHGPRRTFTGSVTCGYRRNPPRPPLSPCCEPDRSRGVWGRASDTLSVLPSISELFILLMASVASCWVPSSINPNPLLWPVSRSVMMATDSTVPNCENASFSESSDAEKGRFPTYNFLPISPPSRR